MDGERGVQTQSIPGGLAAPQRTSVGTPAIEIVDGVAPEYIEASAKTLSDTDLEEFEAQVRGVFEQQARISVTPEWAHFYHFGAGKIPPFLRRLAEDDHNRAGANLIA